MIMKPEDLVVLHEDNHVIVVLKPQNVPCCEDETKDMDLLTVVKEHIRIKENKPGNVYAGLVHRLDRVTGGVMVYAKSSKAASRLSAQMREGDFEKKYSAVVVGTPHDDRAVLRHYVKKNPINNMVYVCGQTVEGAKFCELEYFVLQKEKGLSLCKVILHTGRTHQIRVQMAAIGCPVFGDMRYGGEKAVKGNLALWATELAFTHPVSGQRLVFKVEPPLDKMPWNVFNTEKYIDKF